MQSGSTHDTIAAIATADGAAGVAIVRISGPESWVIAERVVRCSGPCLTSRAAGQFFVAGFADFVSGEMVDRGLVLLFRAPASFTGEDVVVRAHVVTISGYSGHKDSDGLVHFVEDTSDTLKKVFVVMGEPKASLFLVQRLRDNLGVDAYAPERGESVSFFC